MGDQGAVALGGGDGATGECGDGGHGDGAGDDGTNHVSNNNSTCCGDYAGTTEEKGEGVKKLSIFPNRDFSFFLTKKKKHAFLMR